MGFMVLANSQCDVSVFVPAQLSSQLIINMFTGYFVWGDAQYIDRPISYSLVYIICILGVYLISPDVDVVGQLHRQRCARAFSQDDAGGFALGQAMLQVVRAWQDGLGQQEEEARRTKLQ